MCNSLIPFLAILRNKPLFLTINTFFFSLPIYSALKEKKFRVNRIILGLYLPLVNFGMIGMAVFDEKDYPNVYHNLGLFVTVLVFLGALH